MRRCALSLLAALSYPAFASAADVELLCQPCRTTHVLGSAIVTDRQDGRERLILLDDNESFHSAVLYIDFEKETGESFVAPAGAGSWHGMEVPGDLFIIGTFYDGKFMVFDLKSKTFTKVIDFPGESYIWNLSRGSDGRIYGGTYPRGKLGALDLKTWGLEDIGNPAPPNQYCRYVAATPWGQIVAQFGMVHSTTKLYDIASKAWHDVPRAGKSDSLARGVTWNGLFVANDPRTSRLEAFKDQSFTPVSPRPFPALDSSYTLQPQLCDGKRLCVQKGRVIYTYTADSGESEWKRLVRLDISSARPAGISRDGGVVGVRGQGYFVLRPGDAAISLRRLPIEPRPRPTLFIEADPSGRIWGGPHFGQTLFHYDIATGKYVNTDVICDAGGEVYDVAFAGGKVYAASYAGGDITEYDPARPWDQINGRNPRLLADVGGKGYIRPVAGIRVGPDGRLYAGWMAKYGVYGGAVSITDPSSGKTELIENPLGEQGIQSLDVDGKYVYAGTTLAGNGLPHQKGQAKFGVIELGSRKVVFEKGFAAGSVGRVCREPKSGLVAFTIGPKLLVYDPQAKEIRENPVPDLPPISAGRIITCGDTLLTASGNKIIGIDLTARSFKVVAEAPAPVDNITVGRDARVYFNHGPDLYRVATPLP